MRCYFQLAHMTLYADLSLAGITQFSTAINRYFLILHIISITFHRHLDNSIQSAFKHLIGLLDLRQLIRMRDQRCGIDLPLLDEPQDLGAIAAIHAAGLKGQIITIHIRQRKGLGTIIKGYHRDNGIGASALPGHAEGIFRADSCLICRSLVQMLDRVTRTIASRGSCRVGTSYFHINNLVDSSFFL